MPRGVSGSELKRLAQLGARARLEELERERAAILRMFPELGRPAPAPDAPAAAGGAPRRRRRRLTEAERRAISERMRAYWAARRRAKLKKA